MVTTLIQPLRHVINALPIARLAPMESLALSAIRTTWSMVECVLQHVLLALMLMIRVHVLVASLIASPVLTP
jgi:hypothetical protein